MNKCILSKSVDDTKSGGLANTPEGRARIQADEERLEKYSILNQMKFIKDTCKSLLLGKWKDQTYMTPRTMAARTSRGNRAS